MAQVVDETDPRDEKCATGANYTEKRPSDHDDSQGGKSARVETPALNQRTRHTQRWNDLRRTHRSHCVRLRFQILNSISWPEKETRSAINQLVTRGFHEPERERWWNRIPEIPRQGQSRSYQDGAKKTSLAGQRHPISERETPKSKWSSCGCQTGRRAKTCGRSSKFWVWTGQGPWRRRPHESCWQRIPEHIPLPLFGPFWRWNFGDENLSSSHAAACQCEKNKWAREKSKFRTHSGHHKAMQMGNGRFERNDGPNGVDKTQTDTHHK